MKKKWIGFIGCGALIGGLALGGLSSAKSNDAEVRGGSIPIVRQNEADFPSMASLTHDQAVQKALETVPGEVLKAELEDENGFLVYGVDVVAADKSIVDVKIDAGSGKVLAMERDKADDEDHEDGDQDRD